MIASKTLCIYVPVVDHAVEIIIATLMIGMSMAADTG